ncbi:MAG: MBL fold metallo-hydrolase [Spirochaetes bacterium]|nr:MBL fold metallo-hydrolase [Spirochaetota bacterium]
MIETSQFGPITQINMGREMDGRTLYRVSAYLIDGLLIDTGCSHTSQELTAFLREKKVTKAVNTHFHEDHIGGNKDVMDNFGIDIYAHPASIPLIAQRPSLHPIQVMTWGHPAPTDVKAVPDVIYTDNYAFQVIETPGHCAGHVALMELTKGWCFSGDIFTRENVKFIRDEENAGGLIESMRKIVSLAGAGIILFTSLGKIIEDGTKALTSCIEYLLDLAEKARVLVREGHTVDEIVNIIFGGECDFARLTDGHFTSKNLIESLLDMTRSDSGV